jgi:hypothetical protein
MTDEQSIPAFSGAIGLTIEGLTNEPAQTIAQLQVVGEETAAYLREVRQRLDRGEADVDLADMLNAEARLVATTTAALLVNALAADRFTEGCERAERIGLLLDDMARSAREDDLKAAQGRRLEIASALEDFAGGLA